MVASPMDEEEDPLALIVASLEEAAKTAVAAHGAADAARQAALETKAQLLARISGLETSVAALTKQSRDRAAALEKKVDALTTMLTAMKRRFAERYAWGGAGLLLGISLCASMLYLLAMANLRR